MAHKEPISEMILKQALGDTGMNSETGKNKTVLSCGGVYIPHRDKHRRTIHELINTHSKENPVKVIASSAPKNILYKLLAKEILN